jgi:HNH endonuclease
MLSTKLELICTKLIKLKKEAEQRDIAKEKLNRWEENNAYGSLINDFRNFILTSLSSNPKLSNDYCNYNNNIYYNALYHIVNNYDLTENYKLQLKSADGLSSEAKNIISEYCDIMLDEYYLINADSDIKIIKLYFNKLLIPIYFKWKSNVQDYYNYINDFSQMTSKYNISFDPYQTYFEYYNKIVAKVIDTKDNIIFEMIKYLEKSTQECNKLNKYKKMIKEEIKLKESNTQIKKDKKDLSQIDLEILTNQELCDLCKELELKTKLTFRKKEYIDLINSYKSNKLQDKVLRNNKEKEVKEVKKDKRTSKKKKIPASLRNSVWVILNGEKNNAKCFCCKIEPITKGNFECGHIISEKDGGKVTLDNLRSICSLCNKSMGTQNMNEFMKKCGYI